MSRGLGRVLDEGQCRELQGLALLPALAPLASGLSSADWAAFMDSPVAETLVPDFQVPSRPPLPVTRSAQMASLWICART